jgi:hypothetical protein
LYEPTTQDVDDYIAAHKESFPFLKPGKDRNASQAVRHNMRVRRIVRLILIDERGIVQ